MNYFIRDTGMKYLDADVLLKAEENLMEELDTKIDVPCYVTAIAGTAINAQAELLKLITQYKNDNKSSIPIDILQRIIDESLQKTIHELIKEEHNNE